MPNTPDPHLNDALSDAWINALRESSGRCAYCGVSLLAYRYFYSNMELDHVFPRARVPELTDDPRNLVVACTRCNNKKRAFNVAEHLEGKSPKEALDNNEFRAELFKIITEEVGLDLKETLEYFAQDERRYAVAQRNLLVALGSSQPSVVEADSVYQVWIPGIPYAQQKTKGNLEAPETWSQAIRDATVNLTPLRDGPVQLNAFFLLPPDKYPADLPLGPDLDNLLKRLLDALSETVLRELPGRDSAIEVINVRKQRVKDTSEAGVFLTLIALRP